MQPFVDHDLVDLGVAEGLRVLEELGDEHVLRVRRQLDDAVRRRDPDARVARGTAARSPRDRPDGAPSRSASRPRAARRGSSGRSGTSGPRGRATSSRSSRTPRSRPRGSSAAATIPPDPSRPNGSTSVTTSAELVAHRGRRWRSRVRPQVEVRGVAPPAERHGERRLRAPATGTRAGPRRPPGPTRTRSGPGSRRRGRGPGSPRTR